MTILTRRLIFYGLVIIFILAVPPTILYSIGYSFDWQKKALVQTGAFYFKSSPTNAEILIDGKNDKTTTRLISRLLPKTYSVEIVKDGFYPWKKNLEVSPKLVTEARNIILFPKTLTPELVLINATTSIQNWLISAEDKKNQLLAQNIASSSAGWLNKNDDIFYLDKSSFILYRQDFSGFVKEQLSKESLPKEIYKIINSANGRFLALDSQDALFLLNKDTGIFEQIGSQVKDAKFSGDNKKILIQTNNELWILYIEDILIQPYKKTGDRELITRYSQPINQAIFYPNNEYLAFVAGDQIKITELDGRDQRNTVDFISAPGAQIYFDEQSSYFYYLTQNELFRVKFGL